METASTIWGEQERQWRIGPLISLVLESQSGPELYGAFWHAFIATTRDGLTSHSSQTEAHLGARFRL